jgi:membrane protein insertase Oxa1/YidC/SpoIIIJ
LGDSLLFHDCSLSTAPPLFAVEFPKLPLPQFPDVWGGWMGLLKGTIMKLAEVTGSYGTAIIAIVAIVKAITYPLNYQVRPSPKS